MDRRGWPWRKKNSDKVVSNTDSSDLPLSNPNNQHEELDAPKPINYVQISLEEYAKLIDSEEQIKLLNEKLSSALADVTTKDGVAKQHAKVAEEAVSGWEKAEAEALALKHQLESLTLEKLAADNRASHLDGSLKECMRQVRHVKEESEHKMQELVINKSKQLEKVKYEFETNIFNLEQELQRVSAENEALDRSLQERSVVIMNLQEEKSQADAEIENLKANVQSCEREISSMRYELHVVAKELEIRNEERNMSIRSAEAVNKQHLESVKKIAKLEAECQRLRGLVRKKLPGPAALAQMKLEVENLGRDQGESRLHRSPVKSMIANPPVASEYSVDIAHQAHRETEYLTARLMTMDEETKMLREALAKRNSELQASRNVCAKTASKLHAVETQMQALGRGSFFQKVNMEIPSEGSVYQNSNNAQSLTSMSEDGIDDEASCAESWAPTSISELSNFKKEKATNSKGIKLDISASLEVMDDFLEMEKLACMSTESADAICVPNNVNDEKIVGNGSKSDHSDSKKDEACADSSGGSVRLIELCNLEFASESSKVTLLQLQKRIAAVLESQTSEFDLEKLLFEIQCAVQDVRNDLPPVPTVSSGKQLLETSSGQKPADEIANGDMECVPLRSRGLDKAMGIESDGAISKIHNVVLSLVKESKNFCKDQNSVDQPTFGKVENFNESVSMVLSGKITIAEFIVDLAGILSEATEMYFSVLSGNIAVGEGKSVVYADDLSTISPSSGMPSNGTQSCSDSDCETEQGPLGTENNDASFKSLSEEIAQLKLEKDDMGLELDRCKESLEQTKCQLENTETQLSELKVLLSSSQKSNSLAETQLKCMAESYKLLESRLLETENELNQIKAKAEKLDAELQAEQHGHQEALVKCMDLEERLERDGGCSLCSSSTAAELEKAKQEREIEAAAEKLAECQETIFLLGRQLKALRPPTENPGSPIIDRHQATVTFLGDDMSFLKLGGMHENRESSPAHTGLAALTKTDCESSADTCNTMFSSSDTEVSSLSPTNSKRQKHQPSRSSLSTPSAFPTPEKHSRGISRFFSRGKANIVASPQH